MYNLHVQNTVLCKYIDWPNLTAIWCYPYNLHIMLYNPKGTLLFPYHILRLRAFVAQLVATSWYF